MQLKKPTYQQKKFLTKKGFNGREWLVKKALKDGLIIKNTETGEEKEVHEAPKGR